METAPNSIRKSKEDNEVVLAHHAYPGFYCFSESRSREGVCCRGGVTTPAGELLNTHTLVGSAVEALRARERAT
jgi:hypothetical protein